MRFFRLLVVDENVNMDVCEKSFFIKQFKKAFRLLGFLDKGNLVVLTNGFTKKTQKTPTQEIDIAEQRKQEYQTEKTHE